MKTFFTGNRTLWGETGCLSNLYYLLASQAASFSIHPFFPNTISQDTFGTIQLTVSYLCDLWNVMPCHWSKNTSHSTLLNKVEDFPRGGKYSKDVPQPTKIASSKNTFSNKLSKLLSQKLLFQSCALKNYIFQNLSHK